MNRDTLLVVLTVTGSALCWWPLIMEPNLRFPWWLPLALIALGTGLSTAVSNGRWLHFVVVSVVGAFAGLCSGFAIWLPTDGLVPVPYVIIVATLAAMAVSFVAALAVRKVSLSDEKRRRAVGLVLICCVAFGPVALALTPKLVAYRVARNDRVAAERFASLKNAVERTVAEDGNPGRICDGQALRQHYSGPPFSEDDWRFIAGNYVTQQGYSFMIFCHEKAGYTIHGIPWEGKGDGTRQFCTDESGKVGCGMEWNRSRNACTPCAK
jgi:hypothetical protein